MSSVVPSHITLAGSRLGVRFERDIDFETIKSMEKWESFQVYTLESQLHKRIVDRFFGLRTYEAYLQLYTIIRTDDLAIASNAYYRLQSLLRTRQSQSSRHAQGSVQTCASPQSLSNPKELVAATNISKKHPDPGSPVYTSIGGVRYRVGAPQLKLKQLSTDGAKGDQVTTSAAIEVYSDVETLRLGAIKTRPSSTNFGIPEEDFTTPFNIEELIEFCDCHFENREEAVKDFKIILMSDNETECFRALLNLEANCFDCRIQFKHEENGDRHAYFLLDKKGKATLLRSSDFQIPSTWGAQRKQVLLDGASPLQFPYIPRY
ncbi:hypothetical protein [Parashewanella tropica]|uniref:hypothetical protein n=1 Tax=Parashewanella tropica TaxID=2547970 RepID=UPI001059A423|nr:hypothetical protein [Parashewanella tropica]